eukprot:3272870-Pyramimonas_sp.AAC.1
MFWSSRITHRPDLADAVHGGGPGGAVEECVLPEESPLGEVRADFSPRLLHAGRPLHRFLAELPRGIRVGDCVVQPHKT